MDPENPFATGIITQVGMADALQDTFKQTSPQYSQPTIVPKDFFSRLNIWRSGVMSTGAKRLSSDAKRRLDNSNDAVCHLLVTQD